MVTAVAHRGDPYEYRENTLPSVRSALLKGADAVEVDVRLTRDGVPVLLHDRTLDRLWGHPREVDALTLDQVADLTGGELPALGGALAELLRHERGRMLLDLTEPAQAAPAVAAVEAAGARERVYYCGGTAAMRAVRED
ncbi:MAG: glycerophosphodiester phosphodiesterase, partial [Streptomyces sp.]|nr:glycerophosphodiester phosphodiesterase [Streptomyces sp.]